MTEAEALGLATELERPIVELLLKGSVVKTNRWCLEMARQIAASQSPAPVAQPSTSVEVLRAALEEIANHPHCSYEVSSVQVADGHRCAANIARAALESIPASTGGPHFVNNADRWRHDLKAAGWTAESMTTFRDPEGSLWRGPAGAWEELQRRAALSTSAEKQDLE